MEKNEITIDINKLNAEDLEKLAALLYDYRYMEECKKVWDRKFYLEH